MESAPSVEKARAIGRYALFDEIAAGGMATVHLGRLVGPVGFSRTVAIKRLHAQFAKDPDFVAMFLDEARLVGRIRHPNVVPTLDVVQEGDELLLVMEYVQGESLSKLLKRSSAPPPLPITVAVLSGVLHGLHAAHEAKGEKGEALGIVHRDVSPQNVMIGIDGVARLLDFGVAKATQRSQSTRSGQVKGKLAYMAPEQLSSDHVDRRADIFAAGVVLWEMLTKVRLFAGASDARVMAKVMAGDVRPPSESVPDLPPVFDEICARALSAAPESRYATAREMALALEKASPMAPPSEVGAWVESIAQEAIATRAARVHEIESRSDIYVKPEAAPGEDKRGAPWGLIYAAIAVGLGVVVGLVAYAQVTKAPEDPPKITTAPQTSTVVVPATPSAAPVAAASAAPSATAPASTSPPPTNESVTKPSARAAIAPPKPTTTKAKDCSDPFVLDGNGIKHVRPECL